MDLKPLLMPSLIKVEAHLSSDYIDRLIDSISSSLNFVSS